MVIQARENHDSDRSAHPEGLFADHAIWLSIRLSGTSDQRASGRKMLSWFEGLSHSVWEISRSSRET